MKFKIIYDSPGRLRVRCGQNVFSELQESSFENELSSICGVYYVKVSSVNGSILVMYSGNIRGILLDKIENTDASSVPELPLASLQITDKEFKKNCSKIIIKSIIMKMLVPSCLRLPFTVIRAIPFIKKGIAGISEGKINVSVLDAVSISASVMSGSYGTASSVMTLLNISALLEDYARQKAKNALGSSLSLGVERVWIRHEEEHAEVEYVVAHGISSRLNGQKVLIGSAHFIFDDEGIEITGIQEKEIAKLGESYSMIYLAIGGKLCGVLCIEDPIRQNAAQVVQSLKNKKFSDIMMITGDGETTAKNVCDKLGIEKFYAHVLPEDKLNIVNSIQNKSHKVVMVGNGINDSPAPAAADVSVAMKDASDIAREVADITLLSSNLDCLKDYHDYYKTERGYHKRSLNSNEGWNGIGCMSFMNMPILSYSNEIRGAVLMIYGEKAHSCYFSIDAYANMVKNNPYADNKELMIIPNAVHTDLYDGGGKNIIPFDKIELFFKNNLK